MPIDFNSEAASVYVQSVRSAEQRGLPIYRRPPLDRGEAQRAREVRRHVDRLTFGYQTPGDEGPAWQGQNICAACGHELHAGEGRLWRQVYTKTGRVDLWRHELGCPQEDDDGACAG